MKGKLLPFANIDEYILQFPENIQLLLTQIRQTIKNAAPDAIETISYQMPCFKQQENLVYFAAFKNHIGFYPTGAGIAAFKEVIQQYKHSTGAIQFPINEPLPLNLIKEIVLLRVKQVKEKRVTK